MSLGAIDFGLIVDGSVVMIENIIRRLAERPALRSVIGYSRPVLKCYGRSFSRLGLSSSSIFRS